MNKLSFFITATVLICFTACQNSKSESHELTQAQKDSITQAVQEKKDAIRVADSIEKVEQLKADSIENAKKLERQATIATLSKNFSKIKDEFSNTSVIKHKNAPKYTNQNGVYLYFVVDQNEKPENLRFRIQYEDDDWLFIRNMIFNIDGENITFYPDDMETDCGYGGRIWEWCDESSVPNIDLINKIANAKAVKIKLNGRQYYDTRTMSANALRAFKETLQYYRALANE